MSPFESRLGFVNAGLRRWRQDPARLAEAHRINVERMREARKRWPYVPLILKWEIGTPPKKPYKAGYRPLRNTTIPIRVPEPVDVWELMADLRRFLVAWRPSRLRSEAGQAAAKDCLTRWEGIR